MILQEKVAITKETIEKHFDRIAPDYDRYRKKNAYYYSQIEKFYKSIIPESFNTTITINKEKIQSALKAGALFSQGSNSVKLDYSHETQKITIQAESQELGSGVVGIPCKIEGVSGGLLLNFRYVLEFLAQAQGENVVIKIVNDSSPAVFSVEGYDNYLYLVMPIKI